jgi:O-antigen biosynthesis protein
MQPENSALEALPDVPVSAPAEWIARPQPRGKFLYVGDEKLYVRGVTYGTFRPVADDGEYDASTVERDFAQMAKHHINAVRLYTVPPRWLLDAAYRHGLRVMVGLPWEQHVTFLDDQKRIRSIEERVRAAVRACANHPAILCYAIGNEIPASIVRWHGARRMERFLERLYRLVKAEDPNALVTYVNYPSTAFLRLPFVDIVAFNVYIEDEGRLAAYLAQLQNLAGDRPLLMAEVGLDSRRHGEAAQSSVLNAQVRTSFASGCSGVFVFAWTDDWHRGGFDVDDWDFGLTTRDRRPKPALAAVRDAFAEVPFARNLPWPRVSVVVCSHNGARTIRDTLEGLHHLDYPNFETIVVDDGSTDATAMIAGEYDIRLMRTENRGLASARNTGMAAATGDIVAYTDDDCRPDPDWLTYLAAAFLRSEHIGIGGPNIAPPGDGPIADCVANAPGGPVHVLLTDEVAEHIPGCNAAFWKHQLEAIGGFDPQFWVAGDDVDVCWRLQERGWTLGFCPAAVVWHHRRNSVRAYWKQQHGYGKAEALLEAKWPERYNGVGHLAWAGRLYGKGLTEALSMHGGRIYQGIWGSAPFQALYQPTPGLLASLPLMPEWWLLVLGLLWLSMLGMLWTPLLLCLPLLALAIGAPLAQAVIAGMRADFAERDDLGATWALRTITAFLHVLQPIARLRGRLRHGLAPWRHRGSWGFAPLHPRSVAVWSESWHEPAEWLEAVEERARRDGAAVFRGGPYDRWDLMCRGGLLGASRLLMSIEEHGGGKQYARFRWWPRNPEAALAVPALLLVLAILAWPGSRVTGVVLGMGALTFMTWLVLESARAMAIFRDATLDLVNTGNRDAATVANSLVASTARRSSDEPNGGGRLALRQRVRPHLGGGQHFWHDADERFRGSR